MRQPDWQSDDGSANLYCGDCLALLPEIEGVDAVVTDPPYGVSILRGDSRIRARIAGDQRPPKIGWMANFPAIIWGGNNFCDQLPRNTGWLIWDKQESPKSHHSMAELAWCNVSKSVRVHKQAYRGFMTDRDSIRVHPTQKPVALMEWCLSFLADANNILDPYMGSGTTGVACLNTRRKFIGIEIDRGYFDIAVNRIKKAIRSRSEQLIPA